MKNEQDFQGLLKLVEYKLKMTEGENYRGLVSIAVCLVSLYFKEYIICSKECVYIQDKKRLLMEMDFLYYLKDNYHKLSCLFDFEENYKKTDGELNPLRKRLLYEWIGGKFGNKLERFDKIGYENLSLGHQYLYTLMRDFPVFKKSLVGDFKREVGLIK